MADKPSDKKIEATEFPTTSSTQAQAHATEASDERPKEVDEKDREIVADPDGAIQYGKTSAA